MPGDYVVARSFGDVPLIRRVWDEGKDVVYICTEERYSQLLAGETDLPPVGFPKSDVFEYDEDTFGELMGDPSAWRKLKTWSARSSIAGTDNQTDAR